MGEYEVSVDRLGHRVEVVRDVTGLLALQGDWERLYERCPTATPFQAPGWVISHLRAYVGSESPHIVTVRSEDELVALAPLALRRVAGVRVLRPVAADISDFSDVLLHPGSDCLVELFVTALLTSRDWDLIDLPEVPPHASAWRAYESWPGPRRRFPSSVCLELEAQPLSDLAHSLPVEQSRRLRRKLRQMDAAGVEVRPATAQHAATAVRTLVELHRQQWQGRPITPEHLSPRFLEHLQLATEAMVPRGQAALLEYWLDGRVILSNLVLLGHDVAGQYLYGHNAQARRLDVLAMVTRGGMDLAAALRLLRYSMLRGTEGEKLRYCPVPRENVRMVLARPGAPRARLYAGALSAREALVAYAQRHARVHRLLSALHDFARRGVRGGGET